MYKRAEFIIHVSSFSLRVHIISNLHRLQSEFRKYNIEMRNHKVRIRNHKFTLRTRDCGKCRSPLLYLIGQLIIPVNSLQLVTCFLHLNCASCALVERQMTNYGLMTDTINVPVRYNESERDFPQPFISKVNLSFPISTLQFSHFIAIFRNLMLK